MASVQAPSALLRIGQLAADNQFSISEFGTVYICVVRYG